MINSFRSNNDKIKKIIYIIVLLLFIYSFFYLMGETSIKDVIIKEFLSYYNNDKVLKYDNLASRVVYNSLNKTIDFDDIIFEYDNNIINIGKEIEKENKESLIYIYNTHQTESYYLPFISDYSITPNVKITSYILKDHLNDYGINSYVENKSMKKYLDKYNLSYDFSYKASRYYLNQKKKNNKYTYYIDIHRDSASKSTTTLKSGDKKYAKVMFVVGTNHKNYKKNLSFVKDLNNRLNKKVNGITREIYIRNDAVFNQDISKYSILIEVGGVDNTIDELNNSMYVFASILGDYIKENDNGG